MPKLSIGITIYNDHSLQQMIYGNGIAQNIKFLYDLLEIMDHNVFLIGNIKVDGNSIPIGSKSYRILCLREIGEQNLQTDLLLEIGLTVNEKNRTALRQRFGTKIVGVRYGHTMFMDMEQICHGGISAPGIYVSKPDMVWASPHFEHSFSYLETLYSAPVDTAPYIWEPDLVGQPFAEGSYKARPDIHVLEPNLSLLKNSLIPMTTIERLYREAPESFGKAVIVNGTKFNKDKAFLENFVRHMPVFNVENKKAIFSDRAKFEAIFRERDVLLGHQYGCELNYLYLEALHKNIPLVHNSPALQDAGYYYPDFRADLAAEELKNAISDQDSAAYHKKAKSILQRYSIHNSDVQAQYVELIEKTMAL